MKSFSRKFISEFLNNIRFAIYVKGDKNKITIKV